MSSLVFFFFFRASSRKINEGYRFLKDVAEKRGQNKSAKWPLRCSTLGLNHFGIFKIQNVQTKIRNINFDS